MTIGIFDSGVGALNLTHAVRERFPDADLVYFGDTAHMPYGEKSPEAITYYSLSITNLLLTKYNCDVIVIGCNTAASVAYERVRAFVGGRAHVIDVIEPVVTDLAASFSHKKLGVLGTQTTIKSMAYPHRIQNLNHTIECVSQCAPLLAAAIENHLHSDVLMNDLLVEYLDVEQFKNIDAMVLACTHYPLIAERIKKYLPAGVQIVDTVPLVLRAIEHAYRGSPAGSGTTNIYVSDATSSFADRANTIFGEPVELLVNDLWQQEIEG
jgi:glutamate racemase